jgi:hypothetical protein
VSVAVSSDECSGSFEGTLGSTHPTIKGQIKKRPEFLLSTDTSHILCVLTYPNLFSDAEISLHKSKQIQNFQLKS